MNANEKVISLFTTRVRELILRFDEMKRENADLYAALEEKDKEIQRLNNRLEEFQKENNDLRMAGMLKVTSGNVEDAKKRVAALIMEVDKCITLLCG